MIVVLALGIGALTGDSDPRPARTTDATAALTPSAPPRADADAGSCAKVLVELPVTLGRLDQRVVRPKPDTPFVVAWGNPAIVLRCGENRPKDLAIGSATEFILGGNPSGPYYDVQRSGDGNSYTTVDRAAYISITVPGAYQGADYLPTLSAAIAKALPSVCTTDSATPDLTKLCTRRR